MADAAASADKIRKHPNDFNIAAAGKIAGHPGIALRSRDSAIAARIDEEELSRIREK